MTDTEQRTHLKNMADFALDVARGAVTDGNDVLPAILCLHASQFMSAAMLPELPPTATGRLDMLRGAIAFAETHRATTTGAPDQVVAVVYVFDSWTRDYESKERTGEALMCAVFARSGPALKSRVIKYTRDPITFAAMEEVDGIAMLQGDLFAPAQRDYMADVGADSYRMLRRSFGGTIIRWDIQ